MTKRFTFAKLMMALVATVAILALSPAPAAYSQSGDSPDSTKKKQNYATGAMLKQLALANEAYNIDNDNYITNTDNTSINALGKYGFRANPEVALNILPTPDGKFYISYAAHNSPGSTVFYYDGVTGAGVQPYTNEVTEITPPTADSMFLYTYNPGKDGPTFTRGAPLGAIGADKNDGGIFKVTTEAKTKP